MSFIVINNAEVFSANCMIPKSKNSNSYQASNCKFSSILLLIFTHKANSSVKIVYQKETKDDYTGSYKITRENIREREK